jgi:hypothetical protein
VLRLAGHQDGVEDPELDHIQDAGAHDHDESELESGLALEGLAKGLPYDMCAYTSTRADTPWTFTALRDMRIASLHTAARRPSGL